MPLQLTVVGVHGGPGPRTRRAPKRAEVVSSLDIKFDIAQTPHLPMEEKSAKERTRKKITIYVTFITVQVQYFLVFQVHITLYFLSFKSSASLLVL